MQSKDFLSVDKAAVGGTADLSAALAGILADIEGLENREPVTGTWSPQWKFASGTWDEMAGLTAGKYTKIGNLVILHFSIATDSTSSSPSGGARIKNLPFPVQTQVPNVAACSVYATGFSTAFPNIAMAQNTDEIALYRTEANAEPTAVTAATMAAGSGKNFVRGCLMYYTPDA